MSTAWSCGIRDFYSAFQVSYSSCFIQLVGSVHLAKVMAIHFAVYHMPHSWCYLEIAGYKHTIHYIVFVLLVHCVHVGFLASLMALTVLWRAARWLVHTNLHSWGFLKTLLITRRCTKTYEITRMYVKTHEIITMNAKAHEITTQYCNCLPSSEMLSPCSSKMLNL